MRPRGTEKSNGVPCGPQAGPTSPGAAQIKFRPGTKRGDTNEERDAHKKTERKNSDSRKKDYCTEKEFIC